MPFTRLFHPFKQFHISFFPVPGNKAHLFLFGLLIPALLINLGMLPLIGDEAIRAVVALEMMASGDYITPTLCEIIH